MSGRRMGRAASVWRSGWVEAGIVLGGFVLAWALGAFETFGSGAGGTGRGGRGELTVGLVAAAVALGLASLRRWRDLRAEIARRSAAEEALRAGEARLRLIFEQSNDAIFLHRLDGHILDASARACEILGCSADEARGRRLVDLHLPENLAGAWEAHKTLQRDGAVRYESRYRAADASVRHVDIRSKVIDPEEALVLTVVQDITKRREVEIELRQAQKLEAVGQLAAGVAHEVNTPLQYVSDNTRFLQGASAEMLELLGRLRTLLGEAGSGGLAAAQATEMAAALEDADLDYLAEEVPLAVGQSLEGIERVRTIVKALRDFSRPSAAGSTAIDLNQVVRNAVTVSRNEWKYVAEVATDLEDDLPTATGQPGEISQVVLNLILNAATAIEEAVGPEPTTKGRIDIRTRAEDGWVELRVADTGAGIPDAIRDRIFEPFFTTRAEGRGTGQGLSVCYKVLEKHRGTIAFETEVDHGTTFIVRLPTGSGPAAPQEPAREMSHVG